ncbi:DUF2073 domain-containing protein [Candidatus Woesearchaeota archaeon]|nr:DUF2073 domain-containing protein [Candidatus Woesearchaeota archaeon]
MLTLEFVPYHEIESLSSIGRIRKLLKIAKENKIVLLEGRLRKEEETELIKTTMEEINDEFKGIELAVIYPIKSKESSFITNIKLSIVDSIAGNRLGLTIVGPASIVKAIKKDPTKIQLLTKELREKKAKSGKKRKNK